MIEYNSKSYDGSAVTVMIDRCLGMVVYSDTSCLGSYVFVPGVLTSSKGNVALDIITNEFYNEDNY